MTENQSETLFGSLNYQLAPKTELFGDLMLGFNTKKNNTRGPIWTSEAANGNYFLNKNTGGYESWCTVASRGKKSAARYATIASRTTLPGM